jgi:hypothetical protein
MKPTFRLHFSEEHPNRPGLWLNRRGNYIAVLQVDESDLERDKRQGNWLGGQWGAELELVDRDLVPLDKRKVQEYLDQLLTKANDANSPISNRTKPVVEALQDVREALVGNRLELPEPEIEPQPEPQPVPPENAPTTTQPEPEQR